MSAVDRVFVLSAAALLFFCLLWVWRYLNPDWLQYQQAYRRMAQELVTDEKYRQAIMEEELEIKQFDIPSLDRVDRCTTCHRAYNNEYFDVVEEPLRYHAELLDSHPPEKFGCTVCHWGQGRATTEKAGHGYQKHWQEPLLEGDYVQASCGRCHFESYVQGAPMLMMGKQLYKHYGCINCHKKYKVGGTAGPDLTKVGSKQSDEFVWGDHQGKKNVREWLWKHFQNSQAFDSTSKMVNYEINEENAKALTIYMLSLVEDRYPEEYYVGTPPWKAERSAE
jgi:hypothetical protein